MTKFQAGWEFIVALYNLLQRGVCEMIMCVCVFVGDGAWVHVILWMWLLLEVVCLIRFYSVGAY